MIVTTTYSVYLVVSILLTVWVAQTLFKNGRIFLVDVFHGNEALADAVNHLLVVGFYLINTGYVCLMMKITDPILDARTAMEADVSKLGLVMLVLGGMHFFNLFLFNRIRSNAVEENKREQYIKTYAQPAHATTGVRQDIKL